MHIPITSSFLKGNYMFFSAGIHVYSPSHTLVTILFAIQIECINYKIVLFIEPKFDFDLTHQLLSTLIGSFGFVM